MAVHEPPPNPNPNPEPKPITIREVWAYNLKYEFKLISSVIDQYPYVSMDTEFPGVVYNPPKGSVPFEVLPPAEKYRLLKRNVDALKLIQLGMTLSDNAGNLPDLGFVNHRYIWQVNFSDFDSENDLCAPKSIDLLSRHGINFKMNRVSGVKSVDFAELMMSSGLVCSDSVKWITFQGASDVGYLLKTLTGRQLPGELSEFSKLNRVYFGEEFYDVKHLMKLRGLYGGLSRTAESLGLNRAVGEEHQAGSDSLLTWQVFENMRIKYFANKDPKEYAGVLHGFVE